MKRSQVEFCPTCMKKVKTSLDYYYEVPYKIKVRECKICGRILKSQKA